MSMEHLGLYYSSVDRLPSIHLMELVFAKTKVESPLHIYMNLAFHYCLVGQPHTTGEGPGVIRTAQLWHLVRTHEDLGQIIFRRLRSGEQPPQNPCSAFICNYHGHGSDYLCKARGKRFSDYKETNLIRAQPSEGPSLKFPTP